MVGPSWSPCSQYVPYYHTGRDLFVLNTRLETVVAVRASHLTYQCQQHWQSGCGSVLHAWAPDSTLVASANASKGSVTLCWRPSSQHHGKQAKAAQLSALLADLAINSELHSFAWSSCGGLAAATAICKPPFGRTESVLSVSLPGQPVASMKAGCVHNGSYVWSPSGDRLLVDDRCKVNLVNSMCM